MTKKELYFVNVSSGMLKKSLISVFAAAAAWEKSAHFSPYSCTSFI